MLMRRLDTMETFLNPGSRIVVLISASLIQGGVQSFGGIVSTIPNIVVFSFVYRRVPCSP